VQELLEVLPCRFRVRFSGGRHFATLHHRATHPAKLERDNREIEDTLEADDGTDV
jgi:hypothetical protein